MIFDKEVRKLLRTAQKQYTKVISHKLSLHINSRSIVNGYQNFTSSIIIRNNSKYPSLPFKIIYYLSPKTKYISSKPIGNLHWHISSKTLGDFHCKIKQAYLVWFFPSLPARGCKKIKITAKAVKSGRAYNRVELYSKSSSTETEKNFKIYGPAPLISIKVDDIGDPCMLGKRITYSIELVNEGIENATNVKIISILPTEMLFIEAKAPTTFSIKGKKIFFDAIPVIKPKSKVFYRIVCKAIKEGAAIKRVFLKFDQYDKIINDDEITSIYTKNINRNFILISVCLWKR